MREGSSEPAHAEYKKQNMRTWNEIACRYHRRWSTGTDDGPWRGCTERLVELSGIKEGDRVLDLACGTGMVTYRISETVGRDGFAVGIDTSAAAIRVAKRHAKRRKNLDFVNADAERFAFGGPGFDAITCQYALFFFPNAQNALANMAACLDGDGTMAISVHGNNTPYYTSITEVVPKFIPDYLPTGPIRLDRFGTVRSLRAEVSKAGFRRIKIREFIFSFSPGTFEQYWRAYRRYVAGPSREKLAGLSRKDLLELRRQVRGRTLPYTDPDSGRISFPWQVLILTAKPP